MLVLTNFAAADDDSATTRYGSRDPLPFPFSRFLFPSLWSNRTKHTILVLEIDFYPFH
jgi:hypothetical protein